MSEPDWIKRLPRLEPTPPEPRESTPDPPELRPGELCGDILRLLTQRHMMLKVMHMYDASNDIEVAITELTRLQARVVELEEEVKYLRQCLGGGV